LAPRSFKSATMLSLSKAKNPILARYRTGLDHMGADSGAGIGKA